MVKQICILDSCGVYVFYTLFLFFFKYLCYLCVAKENDSLATKLWTLASKSNTSMVANGTDVNKLAALTIPFSLLISGDLMSGRLLSEHYFAFHTQQIPHKERSDQRRRSFTLRPRKEMIDWTM